MKIRVDGATLYVEVDGPESNPALLLWPPGRCTVRVWDPGPPADRPVPRRTYRYPWSGSSSPAADPETQYTFEQYARDACDVLDHLGIERCHVWSQSWGSRPAMVFAFDEATHVPGGQVALDGAGRISAGCGGINGTVCNQKLGGLAATGNAQSIPTLCVQRVDQDRM